jgi:hypothetical protein
VKKSILKVIFYKALSLPVNQMENLFGKINFVKTFSKNLNLKIHKDLNNYVILMRHLVFKRISGTHVILPV